MISDNIRAIRQRISRCCEKSGRAAEGVELICVTKEASIEQMREAAESGGGIFGENRVQDALLKYNAIGPLAQWHLVGHLQTNKAKEAVGIFSLIHSLDSLRLAQAIDKFAANLGKIQDVLIQVNISAEETKFGVSAEEAIPLYREVLRYKNIKVNGLMTIAPESGDPEAARPHFQALRGLLKKMNDLRLAPYPLHHLSMGMTNDFEVAVEEGATMVRIGRAIFRC